MVHPQLGWRLVFLLAFGLYVGNAMKARRLTPDPAFMTCCVRLSGFPRTSAQLGLSAAWTLLCCAGLKKDACLKLTSTSVGSMYHQCLHLTRRRSLKAAKACLKAVKHYRATLSLIRQTPYWPGQDLVSAPRPLAVFDAKGEAKVLAHLNTAELKSSAKVRSHTPPSSLSDA